MKTNKKNAPVKEQVIFVVSLTKNRRAGKKPRTGEEPTSRQRIDELAKNRRASEKPRKRYRGQQQGIGVKVRIEKLVD
ncbi:hypothetical protein KKE26_03310 [bacterium]|nr:hypothetical protein [bacterium]MBU1753953.1 hypothetical protein [bacterium]